VTLIRKSLSVSVLSLPFLVGTVSIGAATTINFNSAPVGSVTTYTESGVTFTALDGTSFSTDPTPNGTPGLRSDTFGNASEFKATLPSGIGQVSVDLGDFDSDADTLVLRAFDSGNNQIGFSSLFIDSSFIGMETLSLSASSIAYVTFGAEAPSSGGSTVFSDNFTFNTAAVPGPIVGAGLPGLVAAFGGLLAWRRRRKAIS
jgi:hypothetical protein